MKMISYFPPTWLVEGDPHELGYNGQNGPFTIKIARQANHPAAVWAQERYEWGYKWKRGLIAGAPVAVAAVELQFWPLLLVAFALALWVPKLLQADMELRGHAIEVQASVHLYGDDQISAEAREARSLMTYRAFRDHSFDDVMALLERKRSWAARAFFGMHPAAAAVKELVETDSLDNQ